MPEYHVGCGIAGIYAGTVKPKHPNEWLNKTLVTDEALEAVRDWLMAEKSMEVRSHGYSWKRKDGFTVSLRVNIEETKEVDDGPV